MNARLIRKTRFGKRALATSFAESLGYGSAAHAVDHHNSGPAYLLKRSEQTLTAMYLERCRSAGLRLTFSQLQLLSAIDAFPGLHQAIAARMTGMDAPTTALVTRSLVEAGLVDRENSSADRRHRILESTDTGRVVKKAALEHLGAAVMAFLAPLSATRRCRLIDLLLKISTNPSSLAPPLCDRDGRQIASPAYLPVKVLPAFLISRCLQVAVSLVGPAVAPFGLSIRQYVALFVLATFEECDLAMLSRALGATRSSLAHILPALKARSLVSINQREQQSRSVAIAPTPAGFQLLLRARPAAENANSKILSNLDRSEAKDFTSILADVLGRHGKLMKGGSEATQPWARLRQIKVSR